MNDSLDQLEAEIRSIREQEAQDKRPTRDHSVRGSPELPNADEIRAERRARKARRRELVRQLIELQFSGPPPALRTAQQVLDEANKALAQARGVARVAARRFEDAQRVAEVVAMTPQERSRLARSLALAGAQVLVARGIESQASVGVPGTNGG